MLGLYGLVLLIMFGGGFFSFASAQKQYATSQKQLEAAQTQVKESQKQVITAKEQVEVARKEVTEFVKFRSAVLSEINVYLQKFPGRPERIGDGQVEPVHRARVEEVDHITFLSNPLFKFRQPENAPELSLYSSVLLESARVLLADRKAAEALLRLEQIASLKISSLDDSHPAAEDSGILAKAHSLRALAYIMLLEDEQRERIVPRYDKKCNIENYRRSIKENLREAKKLLPMWQPSYFWEAMYLSRYPEIPEGATEAQRAGLFKSAQETAITLYRDAIKHADQRTPEPDYSSSAQQNICCCYKRIGDLDGDYDALFEELQKIPSERALQAQHGEATRENISALSLWRHLLMDGVFFGKIEGEVPPYLRRWKKILQNKVDLTDCRKFYAAMSPPQGWQIKLWETTAPDQN
ncbi:MAG: hypothetical protein WA188_15500 [Terriglobales bacterium]